MTSMDVNDESRAVALTIPPKAEYLVFCRLVLTGIARMHDIEDEVLGDLKLAVTEACSNAIRHAYDEDAPGNVQVRYELGADSIAVEVADEGHGFDLDRPHADAIELSEDGMGLAIIRAVVDELEIETGPGGRGSRLRLTKFLRSPL
jgi:serine/threonine-protein kinase RsbW